MLQRAPKKKHSWPADLGQFSGLAGAGHQLPAPSVPTTRLCWSRAPWKVQTWGVSQNKRRKLGRWAQQTRFSLGSGKGKGDPKKAKAKRGGLFPGEKMGVIGFLFGLTTIVSIGYKGPNYRHGIVGHLTPFMIRVATCWHRCFFCLRCSLERSLPESASKVQTASLPILSWKKREPFLGKTIFSGAATQKKW